MCEEVVDTVLPGLCGVVLDLGEADVVHDQGVHVHGRVTVVETNHVEVVVLGEGHEVSTPLGLLGSNQSIVIRPCDALGVRLGAASDGLVALPQ